MSILLGEVEVRRRGRDRGRKERVSIREVCLLGASGAGPRWQPGEQVRVAGRDYRVASAQGEGQGQGQGQGQERGQAYVHLAVEG